MRVLAGWELTGPRDAGEVAVRSPFQYSPTTPDTRCSRGAGSTVAGWCPRIGGASAISYVLPQVNKRALGTGWVSGLHERAWQLAVLLILATGAGCGGAASTAGALPHGRTTGQITSLRMLSESDGWGWNGGLVAKTSDGAASFTDVTPTGIVLTQHIEDVAAIDLEHAWVVVSPSSGVPGNLLERTDDGGATWTALSLPAGVSRLTFIDRTHGWAMITSSTSDHKAVQTELLSTTNGGAEWSAVFQITERVPIQPNVQVGDCMFGLPTFVTPLFGVDALSGCPGATPFIDITHDGGTSWSRVALPTPAHPSGEVLFNGTEAPVFTSPEVGSVFASVCDGSVDPNGGSCTFYGAFLHTNDGGNDWYSTATISNRAPISASDLSHAWAPFGCLASCASATSTGPQLLRTGDGGRNWMAVSLPAGFATGKEGYQSFQLVSPDVGFAVIGSPCTGGRSNPCPVSLYRSTDGGKSFVLLPASIT